MPYHTNSWYIKFDSVIDDPNRNIYFCADDPYMVRPDGITEFIGIQCEPNAISGLRDGFIEHHSKFDRIFAYDEEILKKCPNATLCVYGTTWIHPNVYDNIDILRKEPKISSVAGYKMMTNGHSFRRCLYMNQRSMSVHIDWFRSHSEPLLDQITQNPILGRDKDALFLNYQYSLTIENCRETNYFTEKLIDCLITKTIPIYYGCPNIHKWFDTTGWIILENDTIGEVESKCKNLPVYEHYLDIVEDNYNRAKHYLNFVDSIFTKLNIEFKYKYVNVFV
jgi:hypothetical protein